MNSLKIAATIWAIITIIGLVGEIRCIYKAINCNWDPVDKAEVIYTGASVTGLGCIVGYIDIKDK